MDDGDHFYHPEPVYHNLASYATQNREKKVIVDGWWVCIVIVG